MIHKIITDKNYKKSLKIYAEENGFTQDFTLDELIKDSDFFTYNCEGIWKVQDREKLVTELDDTKDIRMQLKALYLSIHLCSYFSYLILLLIHLKFFHPP